MTALGRPLAELEMRMPTPLFDQRSLRFLQAPVAQWCVNSCKLICQRILFRAFRGICGALIELQAEPSERVDSGRHDGQRRCLKGFVPAHVSLGRAWHYQCRQGHL